MKKRLLFLAMSVLAFILVFSLASAQTCEELNKNVCGTTPNSAIGYGAVDICNTCYICGVSDGVCPEDFYSLVTAMQGSCRNCPDPDCTAQVSGRVTSTEGNGIPGAKIFVTYGNGQVEIATTDQYGDYSTTSAIAGLVKFHASYSDYDTEIVSTEIKRGSTGNVVNIQVSPGACNSDCTDIFGTVCKAKCNTNNGCLFTDGRFYDGVQLNSFYTSDEIASRCDGYAPGTRLPVYQNSTHIVYAECCTGGTVAEERPTLQPLEEGDNECIDNLGTHIVKAKYRGQTVRVVVKSWQSSCKR